MYRAFFAVWLAALLGGCATAITSGTSTVDLLELNAVQGDGLSYSLLDGSRQPIARAVSRAGRIRFELPADRAIGRCVVVLDNAGYPALGQKRVIQLTLRTEYQALQAHRRQLVADEASAVASASAVSLDAQATRSRLTANPARVDGSCQRPADQAAPPRPASQCATRQDCIRDGAALCFTQAFGAGGCELAARELELAGLASNPLCKPGEARRASQSLDTVILGAIKGVAADTARELQRSDSAAQKAIAGVIANASDYARISGARSCADSYVERQLAPVEAWAARARQLRDEPQRLLAACEADAARLQGLDQRVATLSAQARQSAGQTRLLDARLQALRLERRTIDWCDDASPMRTD